jgi:hypothetical protein
MAVKAKREEDKTSYKKLIFGVGIILVLLVAFVYVYGGLLSKTGSDNPIVLQNNSHTDKTDNDPIAKTNPSSGSSESGGLNQTNPIEANSTQTESYPPAVKINTSVQTGTLNAYSKPQKATVRIDNELIGENTQTPAVFYNLTADYHNVSFEKPGYVNYSTTVLVIAGKVASVEVNLTLLENQFGTVNITTDPAQAFIYIDKQLVGETPLVFNTSVDYHYVTLEKEGYYNSSKWIHTDSKYPVVMNLTLLAKE